MRAVLIATGQSPALAPLTAHRPVPMLPLVDRPWIQHVVEYLTEQGVTHFDLVLSHLPEQIEQLLGDGRRWGITVRYHLVREPAAAYRAIRGVDLSAPAEIVLLGHADGLPALDLSEQSLASAASAISGPLLWDALGDDPDGPSAWTGWAALSAGALHDVADAADRAAVGARLRAMPGATSGAVGAWLCADGYAALLHAQAEVLHGRFTGLARSAPENDPGIWISRNVALPASVRVVPPVFIGADCNIGPGVSLGPDVAIGQGCVIDRGSSLRDAVVFPNSYIGRGLEVEHALVDRNTLVNVRLGEAVTVREDFILGSLERGSASGWFRSAVSRAAGLALLVLTSPLLAATALVLAVRRGGTVLYRPEVVRLPAGPAPADWRTMRLCTFAAPAATGARSTSRASSSALPGEGSGEPGSGSGAPGEGSDAPGAVAIPTLAGPSDLFLRFLPGLLDVAAGNARLAGLPARTRTQMAALPQDWREVYRGGAIGLVTEEHVRFGAVAAAEERYAAEAFFAAVAGLRHDVGLVWCYLTRTLWRRTGDQPLD